MNDIEFRLLREHLHKACGIVIPGEKRYLFRTRLAGFLEELSCTNFSQFYSRLVESGSDELKGRLIEAMTTNETSFFRDSHPFAALRHRVFDELTARQQTHKFSRPRIRMLSAGCSTGEEPYSAAMAACEWVGRQQVYSHGDFSVFAVDISRRVVDRARRGIYSVAQLGRNIPPAYLTKYFDPVPGNQLSVSEKIRSMVIFAEQNLAEPCAMLGMFDIIFCRNVMIYFSAELKATLVSRFYEMLQPGGVLFLGASESMYPLSEKFRTVYAFETTYYVKE